MKIWCRPGRIAGSAAALVLALAAQPTAAAPTAPAPVLTDGPASLAPVDVESWIALKIEPAGWTYLYYDGDGAYFTVPDRVAATGGMTYRLEVREELFAPDELGARSMLMETELDCGVRRLRLPATRTFSQHNLRAPSGDRPAVDQWVSPQDDRERAQFDQLCRLAGNAVGARAGAAAPASSHTGPDAGPPPPTSLSPAEVKAWIARYLETLDWRYVGYLPDGVNFLSRAQGAPGPDGGLRAWTRVEFFRPRSYPAGAPPVRSARQLLELDCRGARWRIVEIDGFSQNNLKGAQVVNTDPAAAWSAAGATTASGAGTLGRLCAMTRAAVAGETPPPSDVSDEATVRRWARRYFDVANWTYVARTANAIWMADLKDAGAGAAEVRRVRIRQEFFTPTTREARVTRSERELVEVDCKSRRYRALASQGFSGHELKGDAGPGAPVGRGWIVSVPDVTGHSMADRICLAAAPVRPSRRPSN